MLFLFTHITGVVSHDYPQFTTSKAKTYIKGLFYSNKRLLGNYEVLLAVQMAPDKGKLN